ncbi:MAG: helix-turn-helix transcriptional regulator [Algicola sp.]|nr:helix-turn-helix transcriptional regulator [Algicola sp.]
MERPFNFSHLPSQTDNFVRQRMLIHYLIKGIAGQLQIDAARVEEVAMSILSNSLRVDPLAGGEKINQRQRELAERAQFLLTVGFAQNDSLQQLASQLGASVFHLCRVFKKVSGQSIHQYKNELRLRQALGRIAQGDDLNHIALDLGYSSHSHFTTAFGRYFKHTPKVIRQRLLFPF